MSSSLLPPPPPPPPPLAEGCNSSLTANPRSLGLIIFTTVTTFCATGVVLARLYTRLALTRNFGWDDTFLAISVILGAGLTGVICVLAKHGVGQHVDNVPLSNMHVILVLGFCLRIIHIVVLTTTKLSICIFYRRIFQDSFSNISSIALMAFMAIFTVALFIDGFFACNIGGAFWAPPGKRCWAPSYAKNIAFSIYGSATLSVAVDLLLMAFALWRVYRLGIARSQKISLYAIISLGWLAITASMVRAIRTGQTIASKDPTWAAWDIDIWASLEVNIGLLCASAPAVKPLIRKLFPSFFASRAEGNCGPNIDTFSTGVGYLREFSRHDPDGSVELTDQDHDGCAARVAQKGLQLVTSRETLILDTSTRDIESDADGRQEP